MIEQAEDTAPPAPVIPVWRRRPTLIGAAVVLAAAIGLAVWASTSGAGQMTVHGTISLTALQYGDNTDPSAPADGDSCDGFSGYSDIAPGLVITVEGSTGQPLGSGLLQAGTMQDVDSFGDLEGLCVLPFTVQVPAGQSQYAVSIPGRGSQLYTPAQIAAGVTLSINVAS